MNQEKTADREIQNESVDKAPENGEVDWEKMPLRNGIKKRKYEDSKISKKGGVMCHKLHNNRPSFL